MKGLVDYSSSDESDRDEVINKKIKVQKNSQSEEIQCLPPLPDSFYDHYITAPRTSDDPIFHNGRFRTYEHVPGKWPSHVYLEWIPSNKNLSILNGILKHLKQELADPIISLLENDLGVKLPLHISLSETLMVDTNQKDSFLRSMTNYLSDKPIIEITFHSSIKVLYNMPKTRKFLTLQTKDLGDKLSQWMTNVNEIAHSFGNASLIATDTPHISIGSIDAQDEGADILPSDNIDLPTSIVNKISSLRVVINEVRVRIGRDVHVVKLS